MARRTERLTALITGRAREVGPEEAHARSVLAVTRRIHALERRRARLQRELEDVVRELKAKRREFRAVLQRDASMTVDDARLDRAGAADAVDATTDRFERGA